MKRGYLEMVYCMLVSIQDAKVDLLRREEWEQVAMMCLKMNQWEVEEDSQGPLGERSGLAQCRRARHEMGRS